MNYIGSKYKLSHFITQTIFSAVKNLENKVFCDIFAGTGAIARQFKSQVKKIISNDIEYYSFVLNKNYIENHTPIKNASKLIEQLNNLELIDTGFIYQNYCLGSGSNRFYFSDENGKKIDTIRIKIEDWKNSNYINSNEYYFLLASLLESADKIANTASVYGAFLKHIKKSAQKEINLEPALFDLNDNDHQVFNQDANKLIKNIKGDILYLDPPYNHRQYGANYHLLNTIARYNQFTPKGKTGLPKYTRSKYCQRSLVKNAFEELIKNANFPYIFLSYNNEGLLSDIDIQKIMSQFGKYSLVTKEYQRYKADKTENRKHKTDKTIEYLHILEKQ